MSKLIVIIPIFLSLTSCNSPGKKKSNNDITVSVKDSLANVVHDTLSTISPGQLEKIKIIQAAFFEIDSFSLVETIDIFKTGPDIDKNVNAFFDMANAYKSYIASKKGKLSFEEKKEVYKIILSRSLMPADEAIKNSKLKLLSPNDAREVLSYYSVGPNN